MGLIDQRRVVPYQWIGCQPYMLKEDEEEFVQMVLASAEDVVIVGLPWPAEEPRVLDRLPEVDSVDPWGRGVLLWNRGLGGGFNTIRIRKGPHKGLFSVGFEMAPVLRFTRSATVREGVLLAGIVQGVVSYEETAGSGPVEKDAASISWFDAVVGWIGARYRRCEGPLLVGPHADKWSERGGQLA